MSNTNLPRVPMPRPPSPSSGGRRAFLIAAVLILAAVLGLRATALRTSPADAPGEFAAKPSGRR
jgi:hypothetical protein